MVERAGDGRQARPEFCECSREDELRAALSVPLSWAARDALRLYDASDTQWRVGMAGPTGLDYPAVSLVGRALGILLEDPDVFALVRVLEEEQLVAWSEAAERDRQAREAGKVRR